MKTENEDKFEKEIIGEAINLFEEQVVKFSHPNPQKWCQGSIGIRKIIYFISGLEILENNFDTK